MAQASREWEQAAQQLRDLAPIGEWPESGSEDGENAHAELDCVAEADMKDRLRAQAVRAEEVDEICGGEVKVDVLEHQKNGEEDAAEEERRLLAREDEGEDEEPVEKAIVLEVDVVDYEEPGGEEDRESCDAGGAFRGGGGSLDIAMSVLAGIIES